MTAGQDEHRAWNRRSLKDRQYVYFWADGVHFNIRLEEDRQCILVLMDATAEGQKELLAVVDGHRESEQSWYTLLLDCKQRGLTVDPKLATADGALGFWKALPQVWPQAREQRCWVHKTANPGAPGDKMAQPVQPGDQEQLHQIWMAPTRVAAAKAFDHFVATYEPKYPQALECLQKDRDVLLTFYDFPAEHWFPLRTTNPIASPFATVRLRRRSESSGRHTEESDDYSPNLSKSPTPRLAPFLRSSAVSLSRRLTVSCCTSRVCYRERGHAAWRIRRAVRDSTNFDRRECHCGVRLRLVVCGLCLAAALLVIDRDT